MKRAQLHFILQDKDVIIKVSVADKFFQGQVELHFRLSSFHSSIAGWVKRWIKVRMVLDWKRAA